jgi:hypothetical protein
MSIGIVGQQQYYGPQESLSDPLLDQLTGAWLVTGTVREIPIKYTLTGEWVLKHQFVRLDMRDELTPPSYEASVFIGFDSATRMYVAHWLDAWGGRFSETLGFGAKSGPTIRFRFDYPDGPCQTTFTLNPDKTWTLSMVDRDKAGNSRQLAQYSLQRSGR